MRKVVSSGTRCSLLIGACLLLMSLGSQCNSPMPPLPPTPAGPFLPVGVIVPRSGEQRTYGEMLLSGFEKAFDEWNERGGVQGHTITWNVVDSTFKTPDEARSMIQEMQAAGIHFILGPLDSQAAITLAEVAGEQDMVLLVPAAVADDITLNPDGTPRRGVFRLTYSTAEQGQVLASFASERLKWRKALLLYDSSDSASLELMSYLQSSFAGQIQPLEWTQFLSLSSIESNYDGVFITLDLEASKQALQKIKEAYSALPFIGNNRWEGVELDKDLFTGGYFPATMALEDGGTDLRQWVASYQSHYYVKPTTVAAMGYEAASILLQAIASSSVDHPEQAVAALSRQKFNGLLGPVYFNPQHSACRLIPMMKIEGQNLTPLAILSGCQD